MMEIYDGRKLLIWKLLKYPNICKIIPTKLKRINSAKKDVWMFQERENRRQSPFLKKLYIYSFFF